MTFRVRINDIERLMEDCKDPELSLKLKILFENMRSSKQNIVYLVGKDPDKL